MLHPFPLLSSFPLPLTMSTSAGASDGEAREAREASNASRTSEAGSDGADHVNEEAGGVQGGRAAASLHHHQSIVQLEPKRKNLHERVRPSSDTHRHSTDRSAGLELTRCLHLLGCDRAIACFGTPDVDPTGILLWLQQEAQCRAHPRSCSVSSLLPFLVFLIFSTYFSPSFTASNHSCRSRHRSLSHLCISLRSSSSSH